MVYNQGFRTQNYKKNITSISCFKNCLIMSNFNLIRVTNNLCRFSNDGTLVAFCFQNKLTIRNMRTLDQCHIFSCIDVIEYIEWSPDDQYILCALYQHSMIQVFSLHSHVWKCKLKDTLYGIVKVCWSPDSRHILTTAEFHVSICIWSLVSRSVKYIKNLKEIANTSLSFSPDGRWLVVVEDRGTLDGIAIFSTISWKLRKQIACAGLGRVGGVSWGLDSSAICVWEETHGKCHVQVYEALTGELISNCQPPDGGRIFGIKTIAWVPSGQFLALACFDDKVRLLNHITWQLMMELPHSDVLLETDCTVHQETTNRAQPSKVLFEIICGRPVIISSLQLKPDKPTGIMGIGLAEFSSCGLFLATQADKMPAAIWIWSMRHMKLHTLIVHKQPVSAIGWDPVEPRLAIVSGSNFVSLWSNKKMTTHVIDQICVSELRWHPSGEFLALCASTRVALISLPTL